MKRYFSMSITFFLLSALNALTYLLLGVIMHNTAYSEIFSITYPLQFVVAILLSFFVSASNIRANKENNENCVETGSILGVVFGAVVFGLVAIFINQFIAFMNMDAEIYRNFALMSVGQLFFTFVVGIIAEKLYFQNKDKLGNFCNLGYIVLNLLTVVLTALITKNQIAIVLVNLISLLIYVLLWYVLTFKKFKFDFSITKNFKYESMYVVNDIFMFVIYLFGYSRAFSYGAEFVTALNFVNLITDPMWDAVGAIGKIAKIEISQSDYNYKNALKRSAAISIFYTSISGILFFSLFKVYKVMFVVGLIYLLIQAADMLLNILKANLQNFMQLEHSPTKSTSINIMYKAVRTALSIFILNPYNTNIGQIVGGFVGLLMFAFLRFKHYKLFSNGKLLPKMDDFDKMMKIIKE